MPFVPVFEQTESEANLLELERKAKEDHQDTVNFTLQSSGRVVRSLAASMYSYIIGRMLIKNFF